MHISFSPQVRDDTLAVVKNGDKLIINGESFNFTTLPDGATIPFGDIPCEWIIGTVDRIDGEIHITLLLPIPFFPEPWQAFPEPLDNVPNGPVDMPASSTFETVEIAVEGGKNIVTTKHRWHMPDEVTTTFVPDNEPKEETEQ